MLLEESDKSSAEKSGQSTAGAGSPGSSKSSGRGRVRLLLFVAVLIGGGAWLVTRYLINPLGGGPNAPPPTIFVVKPGKPLPASNKKAWAVAANPQYDYWFEYPTAWTLSIPPQYTNDRARMLEAPPPSSAAIIVIPFGLYNLDQDSEVAKAEMTYLGGSFQKTSDKPFAIKGRPARWFTYKVRVSTPAGWEERRADMVLIVERPKAYMIFLRGDDEDIKKVTPTFERVVKSLHLEKMQLEQVAPTTAPASPAASASPDRSPGADKSPGAEKSPTAGKSPAADKSVVSSPQPEEGKAGDETAAPVSSPQGKGPSGAPSASPGIAQPSPDK